VGVVCDVEELVGLTVNEMRMAKNAFLEIGIDMAVVPPQVEWLECWLQSLDHLVRHPIERPDGCA
jgi:hypothetical protein